MGKGGRLQERRDTVLTYCSPSAGAYPQSTRSPAAAMVHGPGAGLIRARPRLATVSCRQPKCKTSTSIALVTSSQIKEEDPE